MSNMIGADPDGLRVLAKEMDSSAEELERVKTGLLGHFQRVRWAGSDAERAKGDFRTVHAQKMQQTSTMLRQTADLLRRQAQDQTDASSGFGGPFLVARPFLPEFEVCPPYQPEKVYEPLPDFVGKIELLDNIRSDCRLPVYVWPGDIGLPNFEQPVCDLPVPEPPIADQPRVVKLPDFKLPDFELPDETGGFVEPRDYDAFTQSDAN